MIRKPSTGTGLEMQGIKARPGRGDFIVFSRRGDLTGTTIRQRWKFLDAGGNITGSTVVCQLPLCWMVCHHELSGLKYGWHETNNLQQGHS